MRLIRAECYAIEALSLRYNDSMLDQPAPDFELPDLHGRTHRLSDYGGKIVIIDFWSAECPHSERTDRYLLGLLEGWKGEVVLLSMAANRSESRQMVEEAAARRSLLTVLIDAQQVVSDLYQAVTTPHVFVVDRDGVQQCPAASL